MENESDTDVRAEPVSARTALQAELRAVVGETLALLGHSTHPWAKGLAWVLRTRLIFVAPLPFRFAGFTIAVLPLIWLDRDWLERRLSEGEAGRAYVMQVLLHEAAHQLGAIWPEWRNWLGDRSHYGPERNAADAIAESIMRESDLPSIYAGRAVSYVSPLRQLRIQMRHYAIQEGLYKSDS